MDFENYTERSRGFVQAAQALALREGHQRFTPEHLLKVLLDDKEGLAANLIRAAGGDSAQALAGVNAELAKQPKVEGSGAGQLYVAPETARLFEQAESITEKAGDSFVTAERLLLALALAGGTASARILSDAGLTPQKLNEAINDLRKGRTADSASAEDGYDALSSEKTAVEQEVRDLAARLTTAQIRRLQAERAWLESAIEWRDQLHTTEAMRTRLVEDTAPEQRP